MKKAVSSYPHFKTWPVFDVDWWNSTELTKLNPSKVRAGTDGRTDRQTISNHNGFHPWSIPFKMWTCVKCAGLVGFLCFLYVLITSSNWNDWSDLIHNIICQLFDNFVVPCYMPLYVNICHLICPWFLWILINISSIPTYLYLLWLHK